MKRKFKMSIGLNKEKPATIIAEGHEDMVEKVRNALIAEGFRASKYIKLNLEEVEIDDVSE